MTPDDVDTVLTFTGGGGRRYHIAVRGHDGELRAVCGQRGRNPTLKERAVIESHYEPCTHCYMRGRVIPPDAVTSAACVRGPDR